MAESIGRSPLPENGGDGRTPETRETLDAHVPCPIEDAGAEAEAGVIIHPVSPQRALKVSWRMTGFKLPVSRKACQFLGILNDAMEEKIQEGAQFNDFCLRCGGELDCTFRRQPGLPPAPES